MWYAIFKAGLSGILVSVVSETAKRSPSLGALIASLPLVSILGMIWLWRDTHDAERIAAHAQSTFWFVLPSLPMFLVLPWLLRSGLSFYVSLALSCLLTIVLYSLMIWMLRRFGISL
jgi:F0F1-type ATP synthase assembly protein I